MSRSIHLLAASLLLVSCAPEAPADGADDESSQEAQAADPVAHAMTAAPAGVTSEATVMHFDAAGELAELRAGSNGWLCLPDENPATPGDAPVCVDEAWQQWFEAYMEQREPEISGIGISYMLGGGLAASNTDPYATEPAEGDDWIDDGPHLMIVAPDPALFDAFPTDPSSGGPYVMWKDTPYAHLMVPVSGG